MIVNPPPQNRQDEKQVEPLSVDCRTAARMLGVCERTVLKLAKEGKIVRKKIGWRSLYSVASLKAFVESRDNE